MKLLKGLVGLYVGMVAVLAFKLQPERHNSDLKPLRWWARLALWPVLLAISVSSDFLKQILID